MLAAVSCLTVLGCDRHLAALVIFVHFISGRGGVRVKARGGGGGGGMVLSVPVNVRGSGGGGEWC